MTVNNQIIILGEGNGTVKLEDRNMAKVIQFIGDHVFVFFIP